MTFDEAAAYIASAARFGSGAGLKNMSKLAAHMGNPQNSLRFFHVAGTNGKGSVCAYLSYILRAAGYRTGLYTSPDLLAFNERIQVDGATIPDTDFTRIMGQIALCVEKMAEYGLSHPTIFEIATMMAFQYFAEQHCDIVVLEVGLGGRLDATNIINAPVASIITPIGLDHMEQLGGTIAAIAGEKAGIIKPGRQVISAEQPPEAAQAIARVAESLSAPLETVARESILEGPYDDHAQAFSYSGFSNLQVSLLGRHQLDNAALAVAAALAGRSSGLNIPDDAIRDGLRETKWPGRFEVLRRKPYAIVDGAHNPHGVRSLCAALSRHFPNRRPTFVLGVLADKDYKGMLELICPIAKRFITITPPSKRALPNTELADYINAAYHVPAIPADSVEAAVTSALSGLSPEDVLCVFGSLYYIGLARQILMPQSE
jgi:dihydrofolate synthase/folylpolyglutamate synthase